MDHKNEKTKASNFLKELLSSEIKSDGLSQNNNAAKIIPGALKAYQKEQKSLDNQLIKMSPSDESKTITEIGILSKGESEKSNMGSDTLLNQFMTGGGHQVNESSGVKEMLSVDLGQKNIKSLDLSNIDLNNTSEVINKISDYIQQEKVGNARELDVNIRHNDLGHMKIHVEKLPQGDQIKMHIETFADQGSQFFSKHEVELIKSLDHAGIKLADFKITQSSSSAQSFNSDFSQENNQGANHRRSMSDPSHFNSRQSMDNGRERRKELWEYYQNQFQAA